jgi:hypothetical protein
LIRNDVNPLILLSPSFVNDFFNIFQIIEQRPGISIGLSQNHVNYKVIQMMRTLALFSCSSFFRTFLFLPLYLAVVTNSTGQTRDIPYVPTPGIVVERMLDTAGVGPGDYLIDLGSGDGRIVIAAAKRGAIGHGIDIDPQRIEEARRNASEAGVEDNAMFIEGNIFEMDFSNATVITMYLLERFNLKLRPVLLKDLKPGTRVVSHNFGMKDWKPDKEFRVNDSKIFYWVIPASLNGNWSWESDGENFRMDVTQNFQEISIRLFSGNDRFNAEKELLIGDRIGFSTENPLSGKKYKFSGLVQINSISGIIQIHDGENFTIVNWNAIRDE